MADTFSIGRSYLAACSERWRNWKRKRAAQAELQACGPDELASMARDLNLTSHELVKVARKGPGRALRLFQRMAALKVDPGAVSNQHPTVMRDLERCCAQCDNERICADDIASDPSSLSWTSYCPNADTLQALVDETPSKTKSL